MKLAILLCVSVLVGWAAFAAAGGPTEPNCETYADSVCTQNFQPVCGDDGNTYPNECVLCMENIIRNQHVKVVRKEACEPHIV